MLTRRDFLLGSAAALAACRRGERRILITHGVQVGDVSSDRALVWSRCNERARMIVEWDTSPSFGNPRRVAGDGPTLAIDGLPPGQRVSVRVKYEREAERGSTAWENASFATPRADQVRIAWTGDTCGQGFGRSPEWGGLRGYAAMRAAKPDLFIHSGDLIYADNPILPEMKLADGRVWKNISNEYVARVAETLDDFRARFAYNLEDDHVRSFAAEVPIIAQWDDHETHNNWWPGQTLADDRYKRERDASRLAAMANQAMREWTPMPPGPVYRKLSYGPLLDIFVLDCRSFRTPNDVGVGTAMLGATQTKWFIDAVRASKATWKLVACDQPLALVIDDDGRFEGWGNVPGTPQGREVELAMIFDALRDVPNIFSITADVHYQAAHYFPANQWWEFVAGPIHAGGFGPNALDPTFSPELKFQLAPPPGQANLSPHDGLLSFGTIDVTKDHATVTIWGIAGNQRFSVDLEARA